MRIDFFASSNRKTISCTQFGLCDNESKPLDPAYVTSNNNNEWIASVDNNQEREIVFIPIDNNIEILRDNGDMANRCDCLLHIDSQQEIIFVELKVVRKDWIPDGINQLRETILEFIKHPTYQTIYKKKLFYLIKNTLIFRLVTKN